MSFVHLHVHSEYSLLDGLSKIPELVAKAKELEMPALALTDHGAMHGIIKFYIAAKKAGIKPIIGMEGYLAPRSLTDKEAGIDREPFHLLLLAKNYTGYLNLMKLASIAQLEGFYYKPRLDKSTLRQHVEGLISSTGCIQGEIPQTLLHGTYEGACKILEEYLDIFGKENFFIEIQRHATHNPNSPLYKDLERINHDLYAMAKQYNLKAVATNDAHYVGKDDAEAQDILLAIQTKDIVGDPNRKLSMLDSPDYYIKSNIEMNELYPDHPEVIENSLSISELVTDDYNIPMGKMIFPEYEIPGGLTADAYLKKIVYERVGERYEKLTPEVDERIKKELAIVADKGFSPYILIFEDLARFCKQNNILAIARGSAVGSIVHYILNISPLDPLMYDLPFERFLNPERPTPPDIDLDIQDNARDKVIDYTINRYGTDRVAQIATFGTLEARAAVRDTARVLAIPYTFADHIAKLIPPPKQGFHTSIDDVLEQVNELKELYQTNPEVTKVIDLAKKIQGVARHASTHAAGVVVANKPIVEYSPLFRDRHTGRILTQYDMYSLDLNAVDDAIGLLKMDYLGLRTLSVLQDTLDLIETQKGVRIDPYKIPLNEPKVFEMLCNGDTSGVFQMESAGYRQLNREMQPDRFEDLSVMCALYRPGPMAMIPEYIARKKDPKKVEYPHPVLKDVLADTYGIIAYQEQCLSIAVLMAGYSVGRADLLRRAIGKKKKDLMEKERTAFLKGAKEQGYTENEAATVFDFIEKFSAYGFNRGHTASYGLLAYQTAYLKALYPYEFYTALLSNERHDTDKIAIIVAELKQKEMTVLHPNINHSLSIFSIEKTENGEAIRYGLAAIKNIGDGATEGIVSERQKNGPFKDLLDLTKRVNPHFLNRKLMESLIYAGALSDFGTRSALLKVLPEYLEAGARHRKQVESGQNSLFGDSEVTTSIDVSRVPQLPEVPDDQILAWEKEAFGFYLSKNPHAEHLQKIREFVTAPIVEIGEEFDGKKIVIGGYVTKKSVVTTKKDNREMAFLTVNDDTATVEVIVFPNIYQNGVRAVDTDLIVLVEGKLTIQDDGGLKVIADKILIPENKQNPRSDADKPA